MIDRLIFKIEIGMKSTGFDDRDGRRNEDDGNDKTTSSN